MKNLIEFLFSDESKGYAILVPAVECIIFIKTNIDHFRPS